MMKIVASLVILGLCANVALGLGAAPVVTSQSGAFSSSVLNSSAVQILKGSNSTDSANWDSSSTTTAVAGVSGAIFGPGATNDTSYLWGVPYGQPTSADSTGDGSCGVAGASACDVYTISSIRKRTINNTIAGWGNDTTQASVVSDTTVSLTVLGDDTTYTVGPGYLAVLSAGIDSVGTPNSQVWITLVSGAAGSASTTKLTSTSDTVFVNTAGTTPAVSGVCVKTTFGVGNVWYDQYHGAFLYTYWKNVATSAAAGSAGTCGSATNSYSIYLGGTYLNGTALWTTPISVAAVTATASVSNLMGGLDNSNYATYAWIAYKDTTAATVTTYVSKTLISANTTAVGSFSALVKDSSTGTASVANGAGTNVVMTYVPATIWSSNFTYAVTVQNTTTSTTWTGAAGSGVAGTPVVTYGYVNYFNGTTTGTDSGISVASTSGSLAGYQAWQLNTGYTVVSGITAASGSPAPTTYSLATFLANGTVNATSVTAGTLSYGAPQFYEDVNGTQWIGWYDEDTANSYLVYNAYLAKFQGQLNIPTGANVLSAISAFFALFLAAIFVF